MKKHLILALSAAAVLAVAATAGAAPINRCAPVDEIAAALMAAGYDRDEGFYGAFGAYETWRAGRSRIALTMVDEFGCSFLLGKGLVSTTRIRRPGAK